MDLGYEPRDLAADVDDGIEAEEPTEDPDALDSDEEYEDDPDALFADREEESDGTSAPWMSALARSDAAWSSLQFRCTSSRFTRCSLRTSRCAFSGHHPEVTA